MAYRGSIKLGTSGKGYTEMCFLIACESKDPSTCGTRNIVNTATFTGMSVKSSVRNIREHFYSPFTLTTDLLPVLNSTYNQTLQNDGKKISLLNSYEQNKVVLFGIYSNGIDRIGMNTILVLTALFTLMKCFW